MKAQCEQGYHNLAYHTAYVGIDYKHRAQQVMVGTCNDCGRTFECRELVDVPNPQRKA